jgi:hypothetical protein
MSLRGHNGAWLARRHGLLLGYELLLDALGVNLFLEARLRVLSLKV